MASRNVRNSQRKRKSDTPANDGCSDKETNIEDIQSEMDEGEDPGTSEELSLCSISKRTEELFHKIDQLDIRNQIEELKVDINGRDTKMTEDISMLKGIYPEFQVIRGFSQKIPAGLLSYDQIHS